MRRIAPVLATALALLAPAAVQAQVSLHPNELPAGSFTVFNVRVPNETKGSLVSRVVVQFPPGFVSEVSTEFMPGWLPETLTKKLAEPVQTDEGEVTEEVEKIIWTGDGIVGLVPWERYLDFPISTRIPDQAGQKLTFRVTQYYDGGEVTRWTGPPNSKTPAPQLNVTAAGGLVQDIAGSEAAPPDHLVADPVAAGESVSGESASTSSSEGASEGLGIAALIVGGLGLIAGCAALLRSRRPA